MDPSPHSSAADVRYDLVLVGGGLQNGLIALACLARDPGLRIALVERAERPGGNHTWALHAGDVPSAARAFVEPLIEQRYDAYDVRFPTLWRTLHAPYAVITSARFAHVLTEAFARSAGGELWLGQAATTIAADHVQLQDGTRLRAPLVIEARGPVAAPPEVGARPARVNGIGYQKFLGLELELHDDHGLSRPILMDATVEQSDGFRFFYVLPFGPRRVLIEDTCFSRSPELDRAAARDAVLRYAQTLGSVARTVREESGVLPMPWTERPAPALRSPLTAGYQGGFFHPATGYSFPVAVRLACLIAELGPSRALGAELADFVREHRRQARFARHLNQLLFTCFAPDAMWNVFERFYGLPAELIERFYALSLGPVDRARILIGRPPRGFSLSAALTGTSP